MSTAGGQLHGTGRDALTPAAHARLLAAKQHLDSRSSVRCSPPQPCAPHASHAFLTAPHPTPTGATRCPDAHRREHSGCGGGVAPCREGRGLSGVYCTQCPEQQARHAAAPRCSHAAATLQPHGSHAAAALQPPCCTAPLPRQPCPTALRGSPPPLPATPQYVDPRRGACASCDDVRWSAALPALLAALALALAARRLVASSPAVARAAKRAVRRVPLWMRPGLPHWVGTFQSVVYLKIVWCAPPCIAPRMAPCIAPRIAPCIAPCLASRPAAAHALRPSARGPHTPAPHAPARAQDLRADRERV